MRTDIVDLAYYPGTGRTSDAHANSTLIFGQPRRQRDLQSMGIDHAAIGTNLSVSGAAELGREHIRASSSDDLVRAAEASTAGRLILRAIDTDANGLKALAVAVVSRPGHIAVLASTSRPALVAVARSPDLAVSSRELVATLIATFGGRGGGKAELAQAGGLDGSSDAILAAARTAILGA